METIGNSSRRRFVAGGLVTVAAVGLSGCGAAGSGGGTVSAPSGGTAAASVPLTQTEVSEWEKLVGSSFIIATEVGATLATLAALERVPADLNRPASLARHQPFYAYFEMDPRLTPNGGKTYSLSHTAKGAFDLFLGQPSEIRGKGVVVAVLN